MGLQALATHKLRSLLTTLGIVIGVSTVIALLTLIQGIDHYMADELGELGANTFILEQHGLIMSRDDWLEVRRRRRLSMADAEAVAGGTPSAVAVVPVVNTMRDVARREKSVEEVLIRGTSEHYQAVHEVEVQEGRFLTSAEVAHRSFVAVIGHKVWESLFPGESAVGKRIKIGGWPFRVVGVASKKGQMFDFDLDNQAMIPAGALLKAFGHRRSVSIEVQAPSEDSMSRTMDEATASLRRSRKLRPGEPDDFGIISQSTLMEIYHNLTRVAYIVMVGVGGLSLLVGGIGIMNIMLVSVTERTREIGVRKALGAARRDIRWQFLIEALTLSAAGGGLGILLGFGIAVLIGALTPLPQAVTWWSVLLGTGFSSTVGLFFGFYPANRAALLDPIVALRYE
jgi:putative ABC transport system permease protein